MDVFRRLRYFVAVAEERHFGRAAERLDIAQPALSQRIRKLESDLGARLFDRDSRRVELTEAGQILLTEARELLARWERTTTLVGRAHRGELDAVRLGVPPELAGRILAGILTAAEDAGLRLDIHEVATAEQVRLLADRRLDAGLLQLPVDSVGLDVAAAVHLPLGVVLPRDSPLARHAVVDLGDLAGHDLVAAPRTSAPGLYDRILRTCWEHGFRPATVHHVRNPEAVLGLVLSGRGVGFDHGVVARREPRVVWRPLAGDPLSWHLAAARPATIPHPRAHEVAEIVTGALRDPRSARASYEPTTARRPWNVVFDRQ